MAVGTGGGGQGGGAIAKVSLNGARSWCSCYVTPACWESPAQRTSPAVSTSDRVGSKICLYVGTTSKFSLEQNHDLI